MSIYYKSYWRVDAEYQTIKFVDGVSGEAPVGVWIQTLGQPYAYFDSEEAARIAFEGLLEAETDRINQLLITSRKEYMSGDHCSSEELKARLAAKFLMNEKFK